MTKLHEQCVRVRLKKILLMIEEGEIPKKGEFVLIVEGKRKIDQNQNQSLFLARKLIIELMKINSNNEIIDVITKAMDLRRNEIYKLILEIKKEKD